MEFQPARSWGEGGGRSGRGAPRACAHSHMHTGAGQLLQVSLVGVGIEVPVGRNCAARRCVGLWARGLARSGMGLWTAHPKGWGAGSPLLCALPWRVHGGTHAPQMCARWGYLSAVGLDSPSCCPTRQGLRGPVDGTQHGRAGKLTAAPGLLPRPGKATPARLAAVGLVVQSCAPFCCQEGKGCLAKAA